MSITGISAASSAAYLQQTQTTTQAGTTTQATAAQTATQATATSQTDATQQSGQVRHHRHHGGGSPPPPPTDLTQTGTTATGGTSLLNTVV